MMNRLAWVTVFCVGLGLLLFGPEALAQADSVEVDEDFVATLPVFEFLAKEAGPLIGRMLKEGDYAKFCKTLFTWSALILLVFSLGKYALGATNVDEVFFDVVKVTIVWVLFINLSDILGLLIALQKALGNSMASVIMGKKVDDGVLIELLLSVIQKTNFEAFEFSDYPKNPLKWIPMFLLNVMGDVIKLVYGLIGQIVFGILWVVAIFIFVWNVFGIAIVGVFGTLMLPFMLFPGLTFLGESWIRAMATAVLFGVVGRVVMALSVWGFQQLVGADIQNPDTGIIDVGKGVGTIGGGVLLWSIISLYAMFKVGSITSGLISGGGGSGGGASVAMKAATAARKVLLKV